ncbi:MAG: hypothetical protein HUJ61_08555, partial [Bacilli bacterium]|nr:hypothetical protein [Bacilli bacterium]
MSEKLEKSIKDDFANVEIKLTSDVILKKFHSLKSENITTSIKKQKFKFTLPRIIGVSCASLLVVVGGIFGTRYFQNKLLASHIRTYSGDASTLLASRALNSVSLAKSLDSKALPNLTPTEKVSSVSSNITPYLSYREGNNTSSSSYGHSFGEGHGHEENDHNDLTLTEDEFDELTSIYNDFDATVMSLLSTSDANVKIELPSDNQGYIVENVSYWYKISLDSENEKEFYFSTYVEEENLTDDNYSEIKITGIITDGNDEFCCSGIIYSNDGQPLENDLYDDFRDYKDWHYHEEKDEGQGRENEGGFPPRLNSKDQEYNGEHHDYRNDHYWNNDWKDPFGPLDEMCNNNDFLTSYGMYF